MIREFQGEYRWLSNFWPAEVWLDGYKYPTVEHAYQAAKTLSPAGRQVIRRCATPGEAKKKVRRLDLRPDWDQRKVHVMRDLLVQKFQDPELRQKLLATGDEYIQEGNRWGDMHWGVDLRTGQGNNILGRLIMEIREELREEGTGRVGA